MVIQKYKTITLNIAICITLLTNPSTIFAQSNMCNLPPPEDSTLSQYTHAKGINIGAFATECLWDPPDGEVCTQTVSREYTGNFMSYEIDWVHFEPTPGVFNFYGFDTAANFARLTNTKMHIYHLIWNPNINIQPSWLFSTPTECGSWTRNELLAVMKRYIQTVVVHGNDSVSAWNVVNEAYAETGEPQDANGLRNHCFYKIIGSDYIDQAFLYAKQVSPTGTLVLNDYFGTNGFGDIDRAKIDRLIEFTRRARDRGIPIEAIGIQNHLISTNDYPFNQRYYDDLAYLFNKAQAISVPVMITEMNVYQTGASQQAIADTYQNTMSVCLQHPNCKSISTWGISDKYSDIRSVLGYTDAKPLLFDDNYARKLSYYGVMNALRADQSRPCVPLNKPGDANGDGLVDGRDYVIWAGNYNKNVTGPAVGDFDNNSIVDGRDYVIWMGNYGK